MKIILYFLGIVITLFALIKIIQTYPKKNTLAQYDLGYLIGNIILLSIGITLIYFAWKRPIKRA